MDEMPPGQRALGMWQFLFSHLANGQAPEVGPERNIVSRQDAADALLQAAIVIDEFLQGNLPQTQEITTARLLHAMHMLMAARDFVEPLPSPLGSEETLRADLQSAVDAIREGHGRTGAPG